MSKPNMKKFISCDWGTSSFRLRLIAEDKQTVLAEVNNQQGISTIYSLWQNSGSSERFSFYLSILSGYIATLQKQYGKSLEGFTIVISGMASSGIGMLELPYKKMPFNTDGSDLLIHPILPSSSFNYSILFISGVCVANDVMRGEETILAGCNTNQDEEIVFIFPGTHSKHLYVKNGIVHNLKTYMTGEVFDLLANKSILSSAVKKEPFIAASEMEIAFKKGVEEASNTNLLNNIFHVRTNQIFNQLDKVANYYFLSGLLIGAELKNIAKKKEVTLQLVTSEIFLPLYAGALKIRGFTNVHYQDADAALIKGQSLIFKQYNSA